MCVHFSLQCSHILPLVSWMRNREWSVFVVVAGCFFLIVVRIVLLPIFGCLDLVVCGMCEGFSTLMRVCLKLKIAWFHEITYKFYIFRMQIWTDNYSVLSFHLAFSIWHSAFGIRQTVFHFCFICKNSLYFQFIGLIRPSVVGCFPCSMHAQNMPLKIESKIDDRADSMLVYYVSDLHCEWNI